MFKKKLEVVELNKKEEKILLEETKNPLILFLRKHRLLIFLTLLILSLTILGVSVFLFIRNLNASRGPEIKLVDVETNLQEDNVMAISSDLSTDDSGARSRFIYGYSGSNGEVLTVKIVETGKYMIKFYSDGTAIKIMKDGKNVTRVFPLDDGSYGIKENGNIDIKAKTIETTIKEVKKMPYGEVTYLMDGTADITSLDNNEIIGIFVRNAKDINNEYISSDKVTYPKNIENIGSNKVTYYYDGTIEVSNASGSYIVRDSSDISINEGNVSFVNNNYAYVIETKKMDDRKTVTYYSDGGAIIKDGSRTISVRKSNSIIIKNNKIFEIVNNIYVTESRKTDSVTYYTNGGAVVKYDGKEYYVSESGNIKYNSDGSIKEITGKKEELVNENNLDNNSIKLFEETAVVKTKDYIAIVSKDDVVIDTNGKLKEIKKESISDGSTFTITNKTSERLNYRIILDKSNRTNLDTKYIKYQLQVKDKYVDPTFLDKAYWHEDALLKEVKLPGDNYILVESILEPLETVSVNLMLWTDYETIPNAMQDKYFYGTIRIYAWNLEEDKK